MILGQKFDEVCLKKNSFNLFETKKKTIEDIFLSMFCQRIILVLTNLNFPPFMLDQLDGCSIGGGTGY
jgi:hypothetical protein